MGGKSKTKTKSSPYGPSVPSINAGLGALNSGLTSATDTFAQYRPAQDAAIHQIQNNMEHPPEYLATARDQLNRTARGDYVNANPYTDGMAKLIGDQAQGGYNATFGASGRTHGGLAALLSGQGVGDALGNFRGNIYNQERGMQERAILSAPAFHDDEYTDVRALFPAINQTANGPLNSANLFSQGVSGLTGNFGTQTSTQKQGIGLAQIIGLALQASQSAAQAAGGFG